MLRLSSPPRSTGRRAGFTLIELLVVIAIVAILAAILFPIFARARDSAKLAMCTSNLHQIGQSIIMYLDDYNGCYPIGPITDDNGQRICDWYEGQCIGGQGGAGPFHGLPRGKQYSPARFRPLYGYTRKSAKLFRCPGEVKQWCADNPTEFQNAYTWQVFGSSYELNGAYMYRGRMFYQLFGTGWGVGGQASYGGPRNVSEIRNSKRMLLLAERQIHYYWGVDASWSGGSPFQPPFLGHMNDKPWTPAAFCDGHVAKVLMTPGLYGRNWAIAQSDWHYDAARTQRIGADGDPY